MRNNDSQTFVYIDGTTVTGPLVKVQALVAAYVDAKFSAGSGTAITGASSDIEPWLVDLTKKYPWAEWESRELARIQAAIAENDEKLRKLASSHLRVIR
jgi:hypothetical protein